VQEWLTDGATSTLNILEISRLICISARRFYKYEIYCRSDLSKFEYLTMCIKEGMRLHSPVPIVGRDIENDFDLGDRVAPKGTLVQINIWALNHMEHIWGSDHMEFKPGRFSKENIDTMENFQFVPFSAGPR
jgi:cytochrome P450